MSPEPVFSCVLHRGQLAHVSSAGVAATGGVSFGSTRSAAGASSGGSEPLDESRFLELGGGVSGGDSEPESGGVPGGESAPESMGESGGDPGAESGGDPGGVSSGEPGAESGGEPGGDSAFSSSGFVEIRLVAELRREEPNPNIFPETASGAGGFAASVRLPKPPNNFPVTDSVG